MKKKMLIWETIGFIVVCALGSILHFVYSWSGNLAGVGFFSPVNESVWEHLKLLFVPMVLFSILQYIVIGRKFKNYIAARVIGILLGMFAIVAIFYTYVGILGQNYLWIDILTFFIGVAVTFVYTSYAIKRYPGNTATNIVTLVILVLFIAVFIVFTYYTPHIGLFRDPVTAKFGIVA